MPYSEEERFHSYYSLLPFYGADGKRIAEGGMLPAVKRSYLYRRVDGAARIASEVVIIIFRLLSLCVNVLISPRLTVKCQTGRIVGRPKRHIAIGGAAASF